MGPAAAEGPGRASQAPSLTTAMTSPHPRIQHRPHLSPPSPLPELPGPPQLLGQLLGQAGAPAPLCLGLSPFYAPSASRSAEGVRAPTWWSEASVRTQVECKGSTLTLQLQEKAVPTACVLGTEFRPRFNPGIFCSQASVHRPLRAAGKTQLGLRVLSLLLGRLPERERQDAPNHGQSFRTRIKQDGAGQVADAGGARGRRRKATFEQSGWRSCEHRCPRNAAICPAVTSLPPPPSGCTEVAAWGPSPWPRSSHASRPWTLGPSPAQCVSDVNTSRINWCFSRSRLPLGCV